MIRELRKADINRVAKIWLDTNINAHYFISAQYWKSNFELVMHTMLNRIKGCEIYGNFYLWLLVEQQVRCQDMP